MRGAFVACLVIALFAPVAAREKRVLRLRFPVVSVPPAGTSEGCVLVRIPASTPFDLAEWEIRNRARGLTILHSIVYLYRGERLAELGAQAGRVVFSRGCLDLGPVDRDQRLMIAAVGAVRGRGVMPDGVALRLEPVPAAPGGPVDGLGLVLAVNWQNSGARPRRASSRVILRRAKRGTVRRIALPFADRSAEMGLSIPPFGVRSTEDSTAALNAARPGEPPVRDGWAPAGDACVVTLAPRMHKRARFFGADLVGPDGAVRNPPGGTRDPLDAQRTHLYGALDYTDPGLRIFSPPLAVRAGEAIHYLCWHDNGATRALRFGCEEMRDVTPGTALGLPGGGAAEICTVSTDCPALDPAEPGRCVPANLVAGPTPEDETCALTGTWFEAAPGGGCDVGALPPIE